MMNLKLQVKLLIIILITFFSITSGTIFKKSLIISVCSLLFFNSISWCGNANQNHANATIPPNNINPSKIVAINNDYKLENTSQDNLEEIAIPPLIRPPEANLNFDSAIPKDFRISQQIPYSNKLEIVMDSPSTGAKQVYTFNLPDQSFQLHEIEYRNVSDLDFSQLSGTTSFFVDQVEIASVLNNFKIQFNNNQPDQVILANGVYGEFINNEVIIKSPNGTILDTVNINQSDNLNQPVIGNKYNFDQKIKNNDQIKPSILAQSSTNTCQNKVIYNLSNIGQVLKESGNKLAVKNNNTVKNIGVAISLVAHTLANNVVNRQSNLPQTICNSVIQCGQEQKVEGEQQITTYLFSVNPGSDRQINLDYEFFKIPDKIELLYDGNTIFQDGPKSGFTNKKFNLPDNARYVGVRMIAEEDNTKWWFKISCSGNSMIAAIDKWWATASQDKELSVILDVNIAKKSQYELDIDIEHFSFQKWDLSNNAKVIIENKTNEEGENEFYFDDGFFNLPDGTLELGTLEPGNYKLKIDAFEVPDNPIVEKVSFELNDKNNHHQDNFVSLFVADNPEISKNLQAQIDKYAPILYFEDGEKYSVPYPVETTTWKKPKYRLNGNGYVRKGDAETYIDLSDYEVNPGNPDGVIYASIVSKNNLRDLAINYYFHFPRSNWSEHGGINTHEGDWEGITVFLNLENKRYQPKTVAFAQHVELLEYIPQIGGKSDGGIKLDWEKVELENGRPRVYISLGGHASYPISGVDNWWPGFDPWPGVYDESHKGNGNRFDSKGKIIYLPPAGSQHTPEWLLYNGLWGRKDINNEGAGDDGVPGPIFADNNILNIYTSTGRSERWLYPWKWSSSF